MNSTYKSTDEKKTRRGEIQNIKTRVAKSKPTVNRSLSKIETHWEGEKEKGMNKLCDEICPKLTRQGRRKWQCEGSSI